ncbi:hypothetical protein SERLA73DRAFT_159165 [Serpula lacrymans var. lacrymans S7.3]|uniref:DUF6534 domain-containing protein n=1 Tax=Serpula lacrymans var. lacrymans (strain S7.3) TaxID=936435 RepID=F8PPW5_SERL3|nr:hypothetical protein SERLA73DRAFT_159165 [Serpula lacrymans var. lacrymans S7.3]
MLNVSSHYAPLYWGFVCSTCFLGATVVQTYMYFSHTQDRWPMKILVLLLLTLDISSTVLIADTIYYLFVINFGDSSDFHMTSPPCAVEKGVSSILTSIKQTVLDYIDSRLANTYGSDFPRFVRNCCWHRLGTFSGIFLRLLTLDKYIFEAEPIYMLFVPYTMSAGPPMEMMVVMEEGSEVIADLLITVTLCYMLSPDRTGVRVRCVQIGVLVAYLTAPYQLYWIPFHVCKIKLYTNTFRTRLNSRESRIASRSDTHPTITSFVTTPTLALRDDGAGMSMNASGNSRQEDVEKAGT